MTDLIAAIINTPNDDAPRLVYADWLDEKGEPERADYIRKSIRLFQLRQLKTMNEERLALDEEVKEMYAQHINYTSAHCNVTVNRGFPYEIMVHSPAFLSVLKQKRCNQCVYGRQKYVEHERIDYRRITSEEISVTHDIKERNCPNCDGMGRGWYHEPGSFMDIAKLWPITSVIYTSTMRTMMDFLEDRLMRTSSCILQPLLTVSDIAYFAEPRNASWLQDVLSKATVDMMRRAHNFKPMNWKHYE